MLEEYSVEICKIDPYFYEHYGKKIQVDENGRKYILFRIDIYFAEYVLAVELMKKVILTESLCLMGKDKKHLKKRLFVNLLELIRIKKAMMQTFKPVEYKHLSVNLKTDN